MVNSAIRETDTIEGWAFTEWDDPDAVESCGIGAPGMPHPIVDATVVRFHGDDIREEYRDLKICNSCRQYLSENTNRLVASFLYETPCCDEWYNCPDIPESRGEISTAGDHPQDDLLELWSNRRSRGTRSGKSQNLPQVNIPGILSTTGGD